MVGAAISTLRPTATLDLSEVVGALLRWSPDPAAAASALLRYIEHPSAAGVRDLKRLGIASADADRFSGALRGNGVDLEQQIALGVAWARGQRTARPGTNWVPVITRGQSSLTAEFETAETLVTLIIGARTTIRLFGSFVDPEGVSVVAEALAASSQRGVDVYFGYRPRGIRRDALRKLVETFQSEGIAERLRLVPATPRLSFPHIKLLTVDGRTAYLGSANMTFAALTTNVEVGAVVRGVAVRELEALFDELTKQSEPGVSEEALRANHEARGR